MRAHVIGVWPQPKMRVVFKLGGAQRKVVNVILAGGVGTLRDGDTFVIISTGYSELTHQPAVGQLVVDDDRVAIIIVGAGGARQSRLPQGVDWSRPRQPRAGLVVHRHDGIDHLYILGGTDRTIRVG